MIQQNQIADDSLKSNIGSVAGEQLDNQMTLIDDKLGMPLDVTISSKVLTVGPANITKKESDGLDSTQDAYKWRIPFLNNVNIESVSSTLDLANGNTTGDFNTTPITMPSLTASYYVKMAIELRNDGKLHCIFGAEGVSESAATDPAFTTTAMQVALIILQDDGTGGTWNLNTPAKSDVQIIRPAAGGSGGGGSSVVEDFVKESFDDYFKLTEITVPNTEVDNRAKAKVAPDSFYGSERMIFQNIYRISDEYGPNNEKVYGVVGDKFHRVRLVCEWNSSYIYNTYSGHALYSQGSSSCSAFTEIYWYGTDLVLLVAAGSQSRDYRAKTDGGAESGNVWVVNAVLANQSKSNYVKINVASGLAAGWHTTKIRNASSSEFFIIYGFESYSSGQVTAGDAFVSKEDVSVGATTWNPLTFETGTLGTKGGAAIRYLKKNGTCANAVNPTDVTALYGTNTNHANEEMVREFFVKEFTTGRSDDWGTAPIGGAQAYTAGSLDDNTHALHAYQCGLSNVPDADKIYMNSGVSAKYFFEFVGTGLDVIAYAAPGTGTLDGVSVDGVAVTVTNTNQDIGRYKICSGLDYGHHILEIDRNTGIYLIASSFQVYKPKMPSLPADAVLKKEYYVPADFAPNSTSGINTIASGVVRKLISQREALFFGSWATQIITGSYIGGWNTYTNTSGDYFEATEYMTGFDFRGVAAAGAANAVTVYLDGVALNTTNFAWLTGNFGVYGFSGFNSATGVLNMTNAGTVNNSGFWVRNIPAGKHTLKFVNNTTGYVQLSALDIVTPIHDSTHQVPYSIGMTGNITNNAMSDVRKFNESESELKFTGSVRYFDNFTTTSTTLVPRTLGIPVYSKGGRYRISYSAPSYNANNSYSTYWAIFVDGKQESMEKNQQSGYVSTVSDNITVYLSKGFHFIQLYIRTNNTGGAAGGFGSNAVTNTYPDIKVEEL